MRKKIIVPVIVALSFLFLVACTKKPLNVVKQSNNNGLSLTESNTSTSAPGSSASGSGKPIPSTPTYIKALNIYPNAKVVAVGDFSFSNPTIEMTKTIKSGVHKGDFVFFDPDVMVDSGGTITNAYSYIFVTISIKNTSKTKQEMLLTSVRPVRLDRKHKLVASTEDLAYRYPSSNKNAGPKDSGMEAFQPGETKTFSLGFIVPDATFSGKGLYLLVDTTMYADGYEGYKVFDFGR